MVGGLLTTSSGVRRYITDCGQFLSTRYLQRVGSYWAVRQLNHCQLGNCHESAALNLRLDAGLQR